MPNKIPYDEWFHSDYKNPLDSMPIATDKSEIDFHLPENGDLDLAPSSYEPIEPPKEEKTIHQHMYEIATARYNPFSLGGSENCDSDIDCNIGGSENASRL